MSAAAFHCFKCNKVVPLFDKPSDKCPICDSTNGHPISGQRLEEGLDSGAFYNIDPRTGKAKKPKKR